MHSTVQEEHKSIPNSVQGQQLMTHRQKDVLLHIIDSVVKRGYPPTLEELAVLMGAKHRGGMRGHLLALESEGYIKLNKPRGIQPVHPEVRAAICTGMLHHLCDDVPGIVHFVEAIEEEFMNTYERVRSYAPEILGEIAERSVRSGLTGGGVWGSTPSANQSTGRSR